MQGKSPMLFLRLGQIYYEEIKDYELAKAYYDSTIAVYPTGEPNYRSVKKRQEILADFVLQLNTIALQDSLIQLSQMDTTALLALADQNFVLQQEQIRQEEKQSRRSNFANNQDNPFATQREEAAGGTSWYFYNLTAISAGRSEFIRKWGDRPLQDNWRRREALRSAQSTSIADSETGVDSTSNAVAVLDEAEQQQTFRKEFLSNIPFSEAAKTEANKKIEDAYYRLGNIYNFNLEELENAKSTFLTLIDRFPESEYEPEVLYLMYLISNNTNDALAEKYKERLLSEFPNSSYAKTIINPNYKQENEAVSAEVKKIYATAFDFYERGNFKSADSVLNMAIRDYAENDFTDNLTLLRILIIGKNENLASYQFALEQFLEKFPESDLQEYARSLLETSRSFETSQIKARGSDSFVENFNQEHFFVVVYPKNTGLEDFLPQKLDTLSANNFKEYALKSGNMSLDAEKGMVMVNEFKNKKDALGYMDYFKANSDLKSEFSEDMVQEFVITKDNFQILYKTKDINSYVSFFEKHY